MAGRLVGPVVLALAIAGCSTSTPADDSFSSAGRTDAATSPTSSGTSSSRTSRPSSPTSHVPTGLAEDLAAVRSAHPGAEVSVAMTPVGSTTRPQVVGDAPTLVAWSTIKVPIALAIQRAGQGREAAGDVELAITASDNAAAARLWDRLGAGSSAAGATEEQLRRAGDRTTLVPPWATVAGYSPFGQARWRLSDQARFTAKLPCLAGSSPVTDAMGDVVAGQRWGLGRVAGARFKGGWGPTPEGYVVRQLGLLSGAKGDTAVTLQVRADGHEQGTTIADEVAEVLRRHDGDLPTGACP